MSFAYYRRILVLMLCIKIKRIAGIDENSVFIVTDRQCITNSSSALSIITPVRGTIVEEVTNSVFFPLSNSSPLSNINCKIEEHDGCTSTWINKQWTLKDSISGRMTQVITDWRWEEFQLYKTINVDIKYQNMIFTEVLSLTEESFEIPISIRIKQDAHIFLCSGKVTQSSCYWILLHALGGKISALRSCPPGYIKLKHGDWPKEPCSLYVDEIEHVNEKILSEELWHHVRIRKENNKLAVITNDREILTYKDPNPFQVFKIFIHSKAVNGLWKLHKYNYIYCTEEAAEQLGPQNIQIAQGQNCISMFIVMCSKCRLYLTIRDIVNGSLLYQKRFRTEDEKWKEIKLIINTKEAVTAILSVTTRTEEKNGMFWAINNIRECKENEYRMLESSGYTYPCQIIEEQRIIDISKEAEPSGVRCPETSFGTSCLPCQITKGCDKFAKYCESFDEKNVQCFCRPGLRGDTCSKDCKSGRYGHGCNKTCSNCWDSCSALTGICHSSVCKNDYVGPKCDRLPASIMKYPPEIIKEETTSCIVKVSNFEVEGDNNPDHFKIQYREALTEQSKKWLNKEGEYNFKETAIVSIENLASDTEYQVRVVLYSNPARIYEGNLIKYSNCTTSCNYVKSEDILVSSTNTSSNITIELPVDACKLERYTYRINNNMYKPLSQNPLQIHPLLPCTDYTFSLMHTDTQKRTDKTFTTADGVPSEIGSFTKNDATATSITLYWKKPENEMCTITRYEIKYWRKKAKACNYDFNSLNHSMIHSPEPSVNLDDLEPYSVYEITVAAVTEAGAGKTVTIEVETSSSEMVDDDFPRIKSNYSDSSSLIIYLDDLDCKKMRGPVYLKLKTVCLSEWCVRQGKSLYKIEPPQKYMVGSPYLSAINLLPYSNYRFYMSASRSPNDWSNDKNVTDKFTTDSAVPNMVSEVEVTSKDENSISLRWKPPYPPTGILKKYLIKYRTNGWFSTESSIESEEIQCKLWPGYHCATITTEISENGYYSIQIWATNEHPYYFIKVTSTDITVTARTEESEAPYDLSETWTESNDLQMTWKHPNATNGLLTSFKIEINDTENRFIYINSEDDYNFTYTYKLNWTALSITPCSRYTLSVKAVNKAGESQPVTVTGWSPPLIPSGVSDVMLETNSTNHTISIDIPGPSILNRVETNTNSKLYVLISTSPNKSSVANELKDFEESLRKTRSVPSEIRYSRLVLKTSQKKLPLLLEIGNSNATKFDNNSLSNPPLDLGKEYIITLFYVNECHGKARTNMITKVAYTTGDPKVYVEKKRRAGNADGNNGLYALILLIFLVPLIGYAYIYLKRDKRAAPKMVNPFKQTPERRRDNRIPLPERTDSVNLVKPAPKAQNVSVRINPPVLQTTHSKPIKLYVFETYVKDSIADGELARQHGLFPRGQTKPWDYGVLKVNKSKNRYNNLIAYDHTRVKLRKIAGVDHSDYINANYIDGYKIAKAYIATQAPKAATLTDFWRMIWQHNVKHIVMLANIYEGGKKKVEKYWPDINEEKEFNDIKVQYVSSEVFANYEYRVFNVTNNNEQRKVEQLHFTSWPDHGVPLYPQTLVPFLQKLLKIPNSSQSPVVIHCSAGVGRTGTIILCDISLRMAAAEGSVDLLANLEHLRTQRPNMVDNIEQYKLAHLVVLECLFGMPTSIACNDDMDKEVENLLNTGGILKYMRYLQDTEWQDSAMDTVWASDDVPAVYPEKNRIEDILPDQYHRVFLTRYPPEDEKSSYINAVQVDGFRSPNRFIVTQQPMPNTLGDFWRLISERRSTVIISLNEVNLSDETSCHFWPVDGKEIVPVDYLKICHVNTKLLDSYQIVQLHVTNQLQNEDLSVTIICMNNWISGNLLPKSIEEFLSFWEDSDAISRQSDPVIVTCYDGVTASGLYIAMSFIIEKMKLEQECDVCLAVRTIRHCRKEFVTSKDQFAFLYKASVKYINGFQSYANFA